MLHSQKDSTSARFFCCRVRFSGNALLTVGCHRGNFAATLIEMISLRLAALAILAAAAAAACLTYFVTSLPTRFEAAGRLPPTMPNVRGPDTTASTGFDQRLAAEEEAATAYLEAAQAILRRAPNAQASASSDELPITGRIPLPKRRPITRP